MGEKENNGKEKDNLKWYLYFALFQMGVMSVSWVAQGFGFLKGGTALYYTSQLIKLTNFVMALVMFAMAGGAAYTIKSLMEHKVKAPKMYFLLIIAGWIMPVIYGGIVVLSTGQNILRTDRGWVGTALPLLIGYYVFRSLNERDDIFIN